MVYICPLVIWVVILGHWWHAARTLYRDLLSGLEEDASALVEFGAYSKVGDSTTAVS